MTHQTPATILPSSGGTNLTVFANQGQVNITTDVSLLGASPVLTAVSGTGVTVATNATSSSFQVTANTGTAAAISGLLDILTPAAVSSFFFTTATGNNIFVKATLLSPSAGGLGVSSITANSLIYGQGTNAVGTIPPGTDGQALIAATGSIPIFNTFTSSDGSLTFTFGPDSLNMDVNSSVITTLPLNPSDGGTGQSILTAFGVLIGEGSLPVEVTAPGTNGQLLIASSTGNPAFNTVTSTGGTITFKAGYNSLNMDVVWFGNPILDPLPVTNGGTGNTLFTVHGVLIGEGSLGIQTTNRGTNGQLLIASSTGNPKFSRVTSTGGTLTFTLGYNSLNIDVDLSVLTFTNLLIVPNGGTGDSSLTNRGVLIGEGSNNISVTPAGTNGQVLIASSTGEPLFASLTSLGGTFTFRGGPNSLNMDVNFSNISFATVLPVDWGGTGNTVLTSYEVLIGEGSLPIGGVPSGINGQVLLAATGAEPAFAFITSSGGSLTFKTGYNSLNMEVNLAGYLPNNPIPPSNGGTGQTILTSHTVLIGEGTSPLHTTNFGTNGQVLIAATGADPEFATITSLGGSFIFSAGYNSLNIDVTAASIVAILANQGSAIPSGNNLNILGANGIFTTGSGATIIENVNLANITFFNPLPLQNGGTGRSILTVHGVLIGEGSRPINVTAAGTNGQTLIASSTGDPKFANLSSSAGTLTFTKGYNSLNIDIIWSSLSFFVPPSNGGTGRSLLTAHAVLIGEGSLSIHTTNIGTNGQLLIASSSGDPKFSTISSTGGTITFARGYNALNMEITPSAFSFLVPLVVPKGGTGRTILTTFGVLIGEGSLSVHVTAPGTSGQTLIASSTGDPKFSNITSTGNTLTFTSGPNALNMDINFSAFTFFTPVLVPNGGTGRTVLTTYGVLIGNGSLGVLVTPAGTNGQTLIASSTGAPKFSTITSTGRTLSFTRSYNSLNVDINLAAYTFLSPLKVPFGGTGKVAVTPYAVLCGGTVSSSAIQSVGTVGSSGQVLTSNGPGALPSFQTLSIIAAINVQTFNSGVTTYVPTPKTIYCLIECIGGGGAGGGASAASGGCSAGGGGGGGGYASILLPVASVTGKTITVGAGAVGGTGNGAAGGASSVGTLVIAGGGSGGSTALNPSTSANSALGGAGGTGSSGTINLTGQPGGATWVFNEIVEGSFAPVALVAGGMGGGSVFLGGGYAEAFSYTGSTVGANGSAGLSPGAGGGGASLISIGGSTTRSGGNGANGLVIITEYLAP